MMQRGHARRRGAVVQARSSPEARPELWFAAMLMLGSLILSVSALGQDNPSAPPETIQPPGAQTAPAPGPGTTNPPGIARGLIRPPAGIDPGIRAKPPVPLSALPTPVIPPPGTAGGDTVQPK